MATQIGTMPQHLNMGHSDVDDHLLFPRPVPHASSTQTAYDFFDPALCITPEKAPRKSAIAHNKTNDSLRSSQRVRFDSTVEVKHLSPAETSTDTSNVSSGTLDSPNISNTLENSQQSDSLSDSLGYTSTSSDKSSTFSTVESNDMDFLDIIAQDYNLPKGRIKAISGSKHSVKRSVVVRTSIWGEDGTGENVLARPEFNSTIRMRKELQALKDCMLDVNDAVQSTLHAETKIRSKVTEKATAKLSSSHDDYAELVSLDVKPDDILESIQVVKERPVLKPVDRPESDIVCPDLLDLLHPRMQRQSAQYILLGPAPPNTLAPKTGRTRHTFDVYRHIRAWEHL